MPGQLPHCSCRTGSHSVEHSRSNHSRLGQIHSTSSTIRQVSPLSVNAVEPRLIVLQVVALRAPAISVSCHLLLFCRRWNLHSFAHAVRSLHLHLASWNRELTLRVPLYAVFYAARKTARSAAYLGRISLRTFSDRYKGAHGTVPDGAAEFGVGQASRGWWDYVPEASRIPAVLQPSPLIREKVLPDTFGMSATLNGKIQVSRYTPVQPMRQMDPPEQLSRGPSVKFNVDARQANQTMTVTRDHRRLSTVSSVKSRISRYIGPRMRLFKELLRNEVST